MTLSDKNITIDGICKINWHNNRKCIVNGKGEYNFTIRELAKIESELKNKFINY